eukprot:4047900-Pyramimonas_sp.AAC.1
MAIRGLKMAPRWPTRAPIEVPERPKAPQRAPQGAPRAPQERPERRFVGLPRGNANKCSLLV